ncbi:histone H1B-like isoform X2 [Gymnodraco acuticeps]|uniref:Histone H1B-like isoform X2 n=1 Tax=Gymnodraco acuticeps TaxID=8218 RepID=A0A6P8U6J4_GYMAC|nr:histone H1B-like isoform X2 [Gymnodraco acuticeps]
MDLKALETKWRTALSSILDELTENEFRKLLFNLEKIPQGKKEGRPRGDMPSVIIQYYSTEISIALIDKLMKNLPRLDAAVQQPLRGIKDELKKLQEKSKATTSKQSDPGAATMKKKPAAAATSKQTNGSGAVTEKKKPAAAATSKQTNGSGAAPNKKKPAAGTKAAADSGAAPKKKKPAAAATSKQTNGSGAAPKKKKPAAGTKAASDSGAAPKKKKPAAGTKAAADSGAAPKKKKPAAEVSGGSGETQIMGRDSTPNPAWFLPKAKKLPVGAVEPQPKEPAGATLKPKVQSVGIRKVTLKIRGIKEATLKETHLEVDLDTKLLTLVVASRLLANTLDFQLKTGFGDDLLKAGVTLSRN